MGRFNWSLGDIIIYKLYEVSQVGNKSTCHLFFWVKKKKMKSSTRALGSCQTAILEHKLKSAIWLPPQACTHLINPSPVGFQSRIQKDSSLMKLIADEWGNKNSLIWRENTSCPLTQRWKKQTKKYNQASTSPLYSLRADKQDSQIKWTSKYKIKRSNKEVL